MMDIEIPKGPTESDGTPLAAIQKFSGLKIVLILFGLLLVLAAGALIVTTSHVRASQELQHALKYIESGAIKNEDQRWNETIQEELKRTPFPVTPGVYSNLTAMGAVMYNAVLFLKVDGSYEYALTVGNDRVHKRYGHSGKWYVQGRVLHTILLSGDEFLTSPAQRDKVTAARELVVDSSPTQLTLQAHYGSPVVFATGAK